MDLSYSQGAGTAPPPPRDSTPRQRVSLATSPVMSAAASNDVAGVRWALEREGGNPDALLDWCAGPNCQLGCSFQLRYWVSPQLAGSLTAHLQVRGREPRWGRDTRAQEAHTVDDSGCTREVRRDLRARRISLQSWGAVFRLVFLSQPGCHLVSAYSWL